jgi:pSer/pThr/pTyr-binding forkhead associated (FHA) protein
VRTLIPHIAVVGAFDDFSKAKLNEVMHNALATSAKSPACVEVFDGAQQRFLFLRERQIYAAGAIESGQFKDTTIREFLLGSNHMNFPQINLYEVNSKILHSLLIMFQKKPVLRVLTSLVDLDELLDKIEAEGKSCIVSASRENFMAILRYEKGQVAALCHEASVPLPREASFRDEFLVKIYTISADQPLTISLHEDMLVSYAADAKTVPDSFHGPFEELYLSKPPMISLRFKGKEVDHWVFDKPELRIGRTPDNDIVIDNLAVSRLHAVLEEEKGQYYVRDCDSLNGTVLNGQKIGRAKLEDSDTISIGKHTIVFRRQGGQTVPAEETIQGFDQTMIINPNNASATAQAQRLTATRRPPHLVIKTEYGDRIVEIKTNTVIIGKDIAADIAIDGLFVAKRHAEIVRVDDRVMLRKVGGLRKVTVDGKPVREVELKDNDEIRIGNEAFIFHE